MKLDSDLLVLAFARFDLWMSQQLLDLVRTWAPPSLPSPGRVSLDLEAGTSQAAAKSASSATPSGGDAQGRRSTPASPLHVARQTTLPWYERN